MALVACPECGANISDQAPACPRCGYAGVRRPTEIAVTIQKKPRGCGCRPVMIGFLWIMVLGGVVGVFQQCGNKKNEDPKSKTSAQPDSTPEIKKMTVEGRRVFNQLREKHPALVPGTWGFDPPTVALLIPESSWDKLSSAEQKSLVVFMPTVVKEARNKPELFLHDVSETAPMYPEMHKRVGALDDADWVILTGRLSGTGKNENMMIDKPLICGNKSRKCQGGQYAEDFLDFSE